MSSARANGPAKQKRYHHGNLRLALVKAALELIERRGVDVLTLRTVARRAGVSHAAPYRHFRDRAALVAAVAEEGFRELFKQMRAASDRAPEDAPALQFKATGMAYVRFAHKFPAHFRVMFSDELADKSRHQSLREAADETLSLLIDVVAECQRANQVRAGEPAEIAMAAWSQVHGVAALLVAGQLPRARLGKLGPEKMADLATDALYFGLAPRE